MRTQVLRTRIGLYFLPLDGPRSAAGRYFFMAPFLITLDGTDQHFGCAPGASVLRAALRAGIGAPYQCGIGRCGACGIDVLQGQADGLPVRPGASPSAPLLACQILPRSDCTIRFTPVPYCEPRVRPLSRAATLVSRTQLSPSLLELGFHTPGAAEFLPGQFALLNLPGLGERAYAMANLPNRQGVWQFVVARQDEDGPFDPLDGCGTLSLDAPFGMNYLREQTPRELICIGDDRGVSGLLAILGAAARSATFAGQRLWLFHQTEATQALALTQLLARDPALEARLHVSDVPSTPDKPWDGVRAPVIEQLERWLRNGADPRACEFYCSGSAALIESIKTLLEKRRVPTRQMHLETRY